ncbi:MAG: aminopeptidase P family protein [Oscillospiraceae bacterium]|nr:aminopeptidase P family protein [Oscillospiraceae bacterium]
MKNIEKYLSILDGEVDGLLLTSRYSRMYGAEFDIAEGVAIVTKAGCRYFTDSRYIESAQNGITGFEVIEVNRENPYTKLLNEAIVEFGVHTLGFEEDYLTVRELMGYEKKLNAKLVPYNEKIYGFRSVKEPWELERMRKAQDITDKAFSEVLTRIRVGMTEKELQAELVYCLLKNGADNMSFDPIVVSGPNTSMPHGVPGDRQIQAGDFITMDFGALYDGYCADMTRTVAVGYVTEEMQKVYDTVLKAQLAGIGVTKAGVKGREVDGAARKVITDAGYGPYFGHGYGHCLGMEVHESPSCNPSGETAMEVNMVSSAEPGIYLPGKFGVRIEDVVVFTADGCENITHSPKNLIIVEV